MQSAKHTSHDMILEATLTDAYPPTASSHHTSLAKVIHSLMKRMYELNQSLESLLRVAAIMGKAEGVYVHDTQQTSPGVTLKSQCGQNDWMQHPLQALHRQDRKSHFE